jgi:hypothetical protein
MEFQDLVNKAVSSVPAPFQNLAAVYIPVFYKMTQDELVAVVQSWTDNKTDEAQAAIRKKMSDADLMAETEVVSRLLIQRENTHAAVGDFGRAFVKAAISFAISAALLPVGL